MKSETVGNLQEIAVAESGRKHSGVKRVVAAALVLWFGLVFILGARGAFIGGANTPPLPIFFGFAIPLVTFFAAYFGWGAFRTFVLEADLRLVAGMQAWRWAGFGFLAHYAQGVLPALFAFPAALGDMAIGVTAPWIVLGLIRDSLFAANRRFAIWNILGIVDLVVAMTLGTLCSGFFFHGLIGNVTTSAMAQLPLVLIPAYFVPFFIMLHIIALSQARQLARAAR